MDPAPFRYVRRVRRGPIRQQPNGTTGPDWVALDLTCGHFVTRKPSQVKRQPKRARCPECRGKDW